MLQWWEADLHLVSWKQSINIKERQGIFLKNLLNSSKPAEQVAIRCPPKKLWCSLSAIKVNSSSAQFEKTSKQINKQKIHQNPSSINEKMTNEIKGKKYITPGNIDQNMLSTRVLWHFYHLSCFCKYCLCNTVSHILSKVRCRKFSKGSVLTRFNIP